MASALLVLGFLGGDLMRSAWEAVRGRRVSIDLLFLLTLLGALAGSLVSSFTGTGAVYYEVVAILIVVHTAGKMLGARSRVAALRGVALMRRRYDRCIVIKKGLQTERDVPVAEVTAEDRVVVAPGGEICVDGVIVEGGGYVQETSMTGEWQPASRGVGDRVLAGTHSVDGRLVIRPASDGVGERRIDRILAAVEQARLAPSRWQQQADRLMAWFLPLVAGVSAGTFVVWFWILGAVWDRALFNAMAVLLVACPCAMGLATPVAVWGGLARLASLGVVARSGDFLDALSRVDVVAFDKTGTLSESRVRVLGWEFAEAWRGAEREAWLRGVVAAAEAGVAHPVARALANAECGMRNAEFQSVRVVPGQGVVATVAARQALNAEHLTLNVEHLVGRSCASSAGDGVDVCEVRVGERAFVCGGAEDAGGGGSGFACRWTGNWRR